MSIMDFIIIFFIGYFFKDFTSYLKKIINYANIDKQFEQIVDLDSEWNSDDLP